MAHFKFAVSGQVLDLLTSTKGIADDLYTNSFEFDFRSPEWATCSEKWAHFYNSDYNKIGPNGEAEPYDFNLVDDEISAERGVNLPYGIWEVFITGNVILNDDEVVQRFVTETQSIWIVQSGVINAEPLGSIEASEVERLSALAGGAYNARITAATARIEDPEGDVSASVAINGESGTKQLDFVFTGLNNYNKIYWCTYGETTYDEIVEAISNKFLPVVLLTPSDITSAGYAITDDIDYIAVYSGSKEGSTEQSYIISFTSIGEAKSWYVFCEKSVVSNDPVYSWRLERVEDIGSVTKYSSTAKKFYNQKGAGSQEDIVSVYKLKEDMEITAGDVSYIPGVSYPSYTVGAALVNADSQKIFWINETDLPCEGTYNSVTHEVVSGRVLSIEIQDALNKNYLLCYRYNINGEDRIAFYKGYVSGSDPLYGYYFEDSTVSGITKIFVNYTRYNTSTGFTEVTVATRSIPNKAEMPKAPSANGSYYLKASVSNGTPSYSWSSSFASDQNSDGNVVITFLS